MTKHPDGRITYYGFAYNDAGRIGELLVTRVPRANPRPGENATQHSHQEWTGRTWPNTRRGWRDAQDENARMNHGGPSSRTMAPRAAARPEA